MWGLQQKRSCSTTFVDADEDGISEPTQLAVVSPLTSSAFVLPSVLPVRFTRLLQCHHSHDCRLQTPADTLSNSEHYHMIPVPPTTGASSPSSFVQNTANEYFRTVLCCYLTWSGCDRLSHFNLSFAHWTLLSNAPKIHYTLYTFRVKRFASTLPVFFWRFKKLPNKGNVAPLIPGDCDYSCFFSDSALPIVSPV